MMHRLLLFIGLLFARIVFAGELPCGKNAIYPKVGERFAVDSGRWYHVCARFDNGEGTVSTSVNVRYFDASGRVIGNETAVSRWNATAKPIRVHAVCQTPTNAVAAVVFVTRRGEGSSKATDIRFDPSMEDWRDDASATLLLNGSFEEADFVPEFIDAWVAPKGGVVRIVDASHGSHALSLDDGAELCYAKSNAKVISVVAGQALSGHIATKGDGALQYELNFDNGARVVRRFEGGTQWREHAFSLTVPNGASTAALMLRAERSVKVDSLYLGLAPYGDSSLGAEIPVDETIAPTRNLMPKSEVKHYQGVPTWFIDGEPVVNALYTCRVKPGSAAHWIEYNRDVINSGQFPIFVVGGNVTADDVGPDGFEDFLDLIDFQIRFVMSVRPDARFLVFYQQYTTKSFAREYPGEIARVEDSDQGFARKIPGYSYGSEVWSRLFERAIRKLFKAVSEREYGDRIVGFMPGFGAMGENNYEHLKGVNYRSPLDFSPAMANFFRKWLLREYDGDVAAFAAAWGRPGFNFAHAQVPTTLQRVPRLAGGFLDAVRQRQTIDYARCESFSILHRVDRMCRAAKQFTEGRVFTCSQIGYLEACHNHREMAEILKSPWLDSFGPAPGYMNRGPGDDIPAFAPVASLRHHNKVYLFQADVRSHLFGHPKKRFGEADTSEESVNLFLRETGKYMTDGLIPYHWTFDEWFRDPAVMGVVSNFDRFMRISGAFPRDSVAEIAVVLDPLSLSAGIEYSYVHQPNTPAAHFQFNTRLEWHRLGAPYDVWLLDDLLASRELARYKVVVLPAQVALTVDQRHAIREKLYRDGRTLVWMYAPGVFRSDGPRLDFSPDFADICGFHLLERKGVFGLTMKPDRHAMRTVFGFEPEGDVLGWSKVGIYGGFSYPWDHDTPKVWPPEMFEARFSPVEDGDAVVFARYEDDGMPSAAVRKVGDSFSVFWGSSVLDREVLAAIARRAGVHFYVNRAAVVHANGNFCMIHAKEAGRYVVKLPHQVEVIVSLETGDRIAECTDGFEWDFTPKSTLLIYFGDASAYETAVCEVEQKMRTLGDLNAQLRPQYAFQAIRTNMAEKVKIGELATPDKVGFIRDWLFLGPFASADYEGYAKDYLGGESAAVPKAGDQVGGLEWRPYRLSSGRVLAISNEIGLPFVHDLVYYLSCEVISPDERDVLLAVGSDDGEKAWINGNLVTSKDGRSRSCVPDSEVGSVRLRKGSNLLLVKITQGKGGNGHAVRFLDPGSEMPITDLKIRLQ